MFRAQFLALEAERLLEQLDRLWSAVGTPEGVGQVVHRRERLGMLRAQVLA